MNCKVIIRAKGSQVRTVHILINKYGYSFLIYDIMKYRGIRRLSINKIKRTENFLIHLSKTNRVERNSYKFDEETVGYDGIRYFYLDIEENVRNLSEIQFDIKLSDNFFSKVYISHNIRRQIKNLLKRGKISTKIKMKDDTNNFSREQIKNLSRFYHGK